MSILGAAVNKDLVLSKCRYFTDVQVWPRASRVDPERWLSNFSVEEEPYALALLSSFMFYRNELVEDMLRSGFMRLSGPIATGERSLMGGRVAWRRFVDQALIVPVTGEIPNVTDSGHKYARIARIKLHIPQERILSCEKAIELVCEDNSIPVIFVDDFVGSGNQFIETYHRGYFCSHLGRKVSFHSLALMNTAHSFYYCPVFCTEYGGRRIKRNCPGVVLSPTHILDDRHSALSLSSAIWPDALKSGAYRFLKETGRRAGFYAEDEGEDDWRGFHALALALAFEDSAPDATVPIIYSTRNGWLPLVEY